MELRIRYEAGVLEATAINADGRELGKSELVSAKGNLAIQIRPEQTEVKSGKITYINMDIAGENGITESNADEELTIDVKGGTLLGFGSAAPRTEERFDAARYTTYRGKAQAVIRADMPGEIIVTVKGNNVKSAKKVIQCIE